MSATGCCFTSSPAPAEAELVTGDDASPATPALRKRLDGPTRPRRGGPARHLAGSGHIQKGTAGHEGRLTLPDSLQPLAPRSSSQGFRQPLLRRGCLNRPDVCCCWIVCTLSDLQRQRHTLPLSDKECPGGLTYSGFDTSDQRSRRRRLGQAVRSDPLPSAYLRRTREATWSDNRLGPRRSKDSRLCQGSFIDRSLLWSFWCEARQPHSRRRSVPGYLRSKRMAPPAHPRTAGRGIGRCPPHRSVLPPLVRGHRAPTCRPRQVETRIHSIYRRHGPTRRFSRINSS